MRTLIPVLASSYLQYKNFLRNFSLKNRQWQYIYIKDLRRVHGIKIGSPGILLEGYEQNPNYKLEDMYIYVSHRLDVTFISKLELWGGKGNW